MFDKNKDGYITKGELKLAKKNFNIKDIDSAIKVCWHFHTQPDKQY